MELSQWADIGKMDGQSYPETSRAAMHRIAIVGSAGTGKSTLARRLGELMGLRMIHLDALY